MEDLRSLVKTLLEEFREKLASFHGSIKRDAHYPSVANKIFVAIGMRRAGKTVFLLQKIQSLLKEKISFSRILYINFEDDRLYPLTQAKLSGLLDAFYKVYPDNHEQRCYLFLDEIQNVENWPVVIRRFFDSKNTEIYLSGSSAKLLSKEIATSLRGRSVSIEIWPYNFDEYLRAREINYSANIAGKRTLDKMEKYLEDYIAQGGFPEVVDLAEPERTPILQDYVNVVIFRDIIERHKISNTVLIKYMIKSLLKQAGKSFSAHKFFNDIKSQGFAVSKATIHEYLGHIEDAYLVFTVPLYAESLRKIQSNPRKVYAVDSGLVNAYTFSFSKNLGHLFENLVYLDLRRKGAEIYYYLTKNRHEIDFLTRDKTGKIHLYQVVWNIADKETLVRETRALQEAEQELGIKGKLITPTSYVTEFLEQHHDT